MPTTEAPSSTVNNLPVVLTRFFGRERELEDLARLLGTSRLLTLTGPGGCGKTRLACELAAREAGRFEQIAWVDLAGISEPGLIPHQLAQALGVGERGPAEQLDVVVAAIGQRRVLLVLDNCEHLVDACAGITEHLLARAPSLLSLATSREALGIPGETAWLVPSLDTSEAAQLFVERAQQVVPSFGLSPVTAGPVQEICQRLDGMPLAIELAAARIRVLTPDQIAERLSDALRLLNAGSRTALPRHRTLRGALDWSYALLTEFEQALLERLSVFLGTFSIEAAEAVCSGGPVAVDDVLDGISTLVDKSLVLLDTVDHEARYRLLETVRQYGIERLRASGQHGEIRRRHAATFLESAERAAPRLFGGAADHDWMTRLTYDTANLRAAGDWAAESADRVETALRLGWALHWFWFAKGYFEEGRARVTDALARAQGVDPMVRARAEMALGNIGIWQGRRSEVEPLMTSALATFRRHGDEQLIAYATVGLGAALLFEGDPVAAAPILETASELSKPFSPHIIHSLALFWRGWAAKERGEFNLARMSLELASRSGRALDHPPNIAHPLSLLGQLEVSQGRPAEALACFGESLHIHWSIADSWGIARGLEGIGAAATQLGQGATAARALAAADALRRRQAMPLAAGEIRDHDQIVGQTRAALGPAFEPAWAAGAAMPLEEAVGAALEFARTAEGSTPAASPAVRTPESAAVVEPALRVGTLGRFQVVRDGLAIDSNAWGSSRPRELLAFLLCHPKGCSREQAGSALWPEASAAQVRNSFHVTLHRLRKALGEGDWVTVTQDRYQLNPALTIELDAERFEQESTRARKQLEEGAGGGAALNAALELYRGDFLEGEPVGTWSLEFRDRYRRLFIEGQLALAGWLLSENRAPEAIAACRHVIARDPVHEEAWRRLMTAQARAGEPSQAIRSYHQLADLLRTELDTVPDRATDELLSQLQSSSV